MFELIGKFCKKVVTGIFTFFRNVTKMVLNALLILTTLTVVETTDAADIPKAVTKVEPIIVKKGLRRGREVIVTNPTVIHTPNQPHVSKEKQDTSFDKSITVPRDNGSIFLKRKSPYVSNSVQQHTDKAPTRNIEIREGDLLHYHLPLDQYRGLDLNNLREDLPTNHPYYGWTVDDIRDDLERQGYDLVYYTTMLLNKGKTHV